MLSRLHDVIEGEPDIVYAVLFGSGARGTAHAESDGDIAVELRAGAPRDVHALGRASARLESAIGRPIDLVLIDEAPASLAYRIFRDGNTHHRPGPSAHGRAKSACAARLPRLEADRGTLCRGHLASCSGSWSMRRRDH